MLRDGRARVLGTLFAAHAATAVSAVIYRDQATNLRQALESNREIGVAMGVLMTTYKLSRDQSFDLLRVASQNTNRKLRDLATSVADTATSLMRAPGVSATAGWSP